MNQSTSRRRRGRLAAATAAVAAASALLLAACGGGGDAADGQPAPGSVDFSLSGWETDFSTHSVPLAEFHSGGPPRDGIPPIDEPKFAPVADSDVPGKEPVVAVEVGDSARAYPIRILIWHEIVNDEIGGVPIAATFCPLCNTAVVFDRRVGGRTLTFGTTGNLRFSDLVMWDRQTESWWQQFSGEAVVGELTGAKLTRVPAGLVSMDEFRRLHPDGQVLSEDTGHSRPYGENPYSGYDEADSRPFLLQDRSPDGRLAPKVRVVTMLRGETMVVVPLDVAMEKRVVHDGPAVVWWQPGTTSALDDGRIVEGRDIGSVRVYSRRLDGRTLTFRAEGDALMDVATGSRFARDGRATSGSLSGKRLTALAHDTPFWFAVAAFRPDARIVGQG